jgi:proline iminopeptidase
MLRRLLVIGAAVASAGAAVGIVRARAEFRRWGCDPVEAGRALPGDEIVPEAEAVDTRGIDIAAPPEKVWPWLLQMGYGRAGWYSYDQLDTSHPSADHIVPELQELAVGDIVPTHPGGGFEVRILEPERALVLYADRALIDSQAHAAAESKTGLKDASPNVRATGAYLDAAMKGDFRASWAFVLEPRGSDRTRLIERFRGTMELPAAAEGAPGTAIGPAVASKALLFGRFVMVRRQLLGIRDRVEGRPTAAFPWAAPQWRSAAHEATTRVTAPTPA